jgi:hypothetical protein
MAAQDNLSPKQFSLPINDVLKLDSYDAPLRGLKTVGQLLPHTKAQMAEYKNKDIGLKNPAHEYYQGIRQSMVENGQTEPIPLYKGAVTGGHHRIAIAHDLGWSSLDLKEIEP